MQLHFYSAETKDTSIIAYANTHQKKRHFKISYKKDVYCAFKKVCGKYQKLAESKNLEFAKNACNNSWNLSNPTK